MSSTEGCHHDRMKKNRGAVQWSSDNRYIAVESSQQRPSGMMLKHAAENADL